MDRVMCGEVQWQERGKPLGYCTATRGTEHSHGDGDMLQPMPDGEYTVEIEIIDGIVENMYVDALEPI